MQIDRSEFAVRETSESQARFTDIKSEKIIKAFARQLEALRQYHLDRRSLSNTGSIALAFEQQQRSDTGIYNGAGLHLPAHPQTIILIGRLGQRWGRSSVYEVQGVFKECGKADQLTDIADERPDLEIETAVRAIMLQRKEPNLTTMLVRPVSAELGASSEPVDEHSIAPLRIYRTVQTLKPRVTF